jgi:hypothetical protein
MRDLSCAFDSMSREITKARVIPGREFCAKLTKSILSLNERTRNPAVLHWVWIPGSREGARPGMTGVTSCA